MSLETMTKLATTTVGVGGQASVSFSNIPQSYTDLRIVFSARDTSNSGSQWSSATLIFNGITTGYQSRVVFGSNTGTGSATGGTTSIPYLYATSSSATASVFGNTEIYIPGYSGFTNKTVGADTVTEHNATPTFLGFTTGGWSNTSPITSLTLTAETSFAQHSTFTLYGVKAMRTAAGNSIKATGGNISFDGTYVTHTFNTTDTFTPTQPILVDYLVVAGGGGGGAYIGGGGGAGGLRCTVGATGGGGTVESRLSLTAQAYTVTIGAGGAAGQSDSTAPINGNNSVFSTITSTGGGRGGYYTGADWTTGATGGSGGGGGIAYGGGSGTNNQGYAGGTGAANTGATSTAAGGGGAGALGYSGATSVPGNGGNGVATSISGSSVTYAGGGGGSAHSSFTGTSTGGTGGGGAGGSSSANGTSGTANTGGGGGGGGVARSGGAGGSGVVIVRYRA